MERVEVSGEGFLFGYGIFETIKIENKIAQNIELHFKRLENSAKELGIFFNISFKEFRYIINSEIENLKEKDFILRFSLIKDGDKSKYFINSRKNSYLPEKYKIGFKLKISNIKRNSSSKIIYHKTLNYMENYTELIKAKNLGYDEIIFFNEKGYLCEGAISNIFLIIEDKIWTPRVENGLLAGIKRAEVLNKLKLLGENVIEKDITSDMLFSAKEIFITNSILGIMKVSSIENKKYNFDKIEKIKQKLEID